MVSKNQLLIYFSARSVVYGSVAVAWYCSRFSGQLKHNLPRDNQYNSLCFLQAGSAKLCALE